MTDPSKYDKLFQRRIGLGEIAQVAAKYLKDELKFVYDTDCTCILLFFCKGGFNVDYSTIE